MACVITRMSNQLKRLLKEIHHLGVTVFENLIVGLKNRKWVDEQFSVSVKYGIEPIFVTNTFYFVTFRKEQ